MTRMTFSIEIAGATHGFREYERAYRSRRDDGSGAHALSEVRSAPAPIAFTRSRLCVHEVIDPLFNNAFPNATTIRIESRGADAGRRRAKLHVDQTAPPEGGAVGAAYAEQLAAINFDVKVPK